MLGSSKQPQTFSRQHFEDVDEEKDEDHDNKSEDEQEPQAKEQPEQEENDDIRINADFPLIRADLGRYFTSYYIPV